ncbi:MAG TPA: bifunctional phosphoribosyl-AMP cyclohydrolase/phosphoribosyl-ATP diphosphatase HisIE [Steroidobacteraceae bacterium]|jgi:phosphoribosyl-ATP pyrophosphohydrolase/phosphoribosyl-AMP cyclohydrolase
MNFTAAEIDRIDWGKADGLVPAIVQHERSGTLLMLGYMNRAALEHTLARGRVVFYSRSKGRLWEKGESSGHHLTLVDVRRDCDADALLITALPAGPVCHTGSQSCFGDDELTGAQGLSFVLELERVIDARITEGAADSYTASLHARGLKRVAQKVGEEGLEVALAGAAEDDDALLRESADLLFHLLLLLRARALPLSAVIAELRRRHQARQRV